jgi:hypothetical protein
MLAIFTSGLLIVREDQRVLMLQSGLSMRHAGRSMETSSAINWS